MSSDVKVPPAILVKKDEAKKGEVWSNTAKQRFIKQHGSVDEIPEGDAHAVRIYQDPTYVPPASPEERKAMEDKLEEQIKKLKTQPQSQLQPPLPPEPKGNNFYDEWID